jgi:hypothetical protein
MTTVLFYKKWTDPEFDLYDDKNNKYTDWLVKPMELVRKTLDVIHPKIDYVKIDRWDTWSMDSTLANIVHPMLVQLQRDKHGAPFVDDEDVPEELRSTSAPAKENEWDTDSNHFKRWEWAMNEMIWAFGEKVKDDWQDQYYSGEHDTKMVKSEKTYTNSETGKTESTWEMVKGPNDTFKIDMEGLKAHQERMSRGFKLFGKYYEGLWD